MEENKTPESTQSTEELIQELRDSQGPGDALFEMGPQGSNMTFGPDVEADEKLVEEFVNMGKRQMEIETQFEMPVLMKSMQEADRLLSEWYAEQNPESAETPENTEG